MPGPVSDSARGSFEFTPYVPSICYRDGPRMCPCGHHEGFHADDGTCKLSAQCGCPGIPRSCVTPVAQC